MLDSKTTGFAAGAADDGDARAGQARPFTKTLA
jgi:hypothetical protein